MTKRFVRSRETTTKKGTEMNLKRRIERMERELKPGELRVMQTPVISRLLARN
jgi:hypothetical protein